jgi:hypothetical protein
MKPFLSLTLLSMVALSATISSKTVEASEASMGVKLELTDQTRNTKPLSLSLTLNGVEGCASVDDRTAAGELHVQICRDGGDDRSPVLSFHVERTLNLDKGTERRQFRVKLKLALGRPQRIGRFGEGASAMDLLATARLIPSEGLGEGARSP